jgi:GTPase SAR1 family protein
MALAGGSVGHPSSSGSRTGVRVVVAGDHGTGKSSLIAAASSESFPENVPPVLHPTRLPADFFSDRVPVTLIDTSSRFLPPCIYIYVCVCVCVCVCMCVCVSACVAEEAEEIE